MRKIENFIIFALAAHGKGLSGSDRIFIELSRRWSKLFPVTIYLWNEGLVMCKAQHLNDSGVIFCVSNIKSRQNLGFLINYCQRIFEGIKIGLTLKIENKDSIYIYSASDFWMDCLPAFFLKLRFPKIRWVGSWYLTAPNPYQAFMIRKKIDLALLRLLVYFFMQQPVYLILEKFADIIFVTSDPDSKRFPKQLERKEIVVVRGGVNFSKDHFKRKNIRKIYDAVFQGRFHPQKGVIELIDIWRLVVNELKSAKLIMLGDGPLMKNVIEKIKKLKLRNNIKLTGYLFDGDKKNKIFSESKIFVHPVIYDSGGMAAAEGMAFGLPAVGFDLESLKSYYPVGMLKVPLNNQKAFADSITSLLTNKKLYNNISNQAIKHIRSYWDWDVRSKEILNQISKIN